MLRHSSTSNPISGKKREADTQRAPHFFQGKPPATSEAAQKKTRTETVSKKAPKEVQPKAQEIQLRTPTEFLLAAILEELRVRNKIELIKLEAQEKEKQEELEALQMEQEEDKARFERTGPSMYM